MSWATQVTAVLQSFYLSLTALKAILSLHSILISCVLTPGGSPCSTIPPPQLQALKMSPHFQLLLTLLLKAHLYLVSSFLRGRAVPFVLPRPTSPLEFWIPSCWIFSFRHWINTYYLLCARHCTRQVIQWCLRLQSLCLCEAHSLVEGDRKCTK